MASTTINASANSGAIRSNDTVYATARAGSGTLTTITDVDARIGQSFGAPNYFCWQQFLEFDLSALSGATITAAVLSVYVWAIDGTPGYVIEARARDYGGSITTGDFVAGASLSGLTSLATWTSAAPDSEYKAFTDVAMVGFLTPGAVNRIVLAGANQRTNSTPSGSEYITAYFSNGAGFPPKLDITYTPAAASAGRSASLLSLGSLRGISR